MYVKILRMIESCRLLIYDNFLYGRRINNNLLQPERFTQPPNLPQRGSVTTKKSTKSVTSLAASSYFLILLPCVIVQKQAVEVEQRLFVILDLFKAHNCWKTAILHLHLFKTQNIEKRRKTLIQGPTDNSKR